MQLSPDLANILYSFNNLFEQSLFPANLMRSASSAGETITRSSQEAHVSIPKRAETFNGASSKESQMSSININADILKARVYKNAISAGCINGLMNGSTKIDGSATSGATISSSSDSGCSVVNPNIISSDLSADSGYHSRLCVDQNHDTENCSCTVFDNNLNKIKQLSLANRTANGKSNSKSSNGTSASSCSNSSTATSSSSGTTSIPKTHFESILKYILNDYVRLKSENENLKRELETKNGSLDVFKSTMEECKVCI